MSRYADEKVDAMRTQKDEELEHYKKEIERAKRFEHKQHGAGAAAQPDAGHGRPQIKQLPADRIQGVKTRAPGLNGSRLGAQQY